AVLPPSIAWVYRSIAVTCRVRLQTPDHLEETLARDGRALLALWHETTGILLWYYRGRNFHSTASYSFDGELAARVVHQFGAECVRGSSCRGGKLALDEMQKVVGQVPCVGITLDGPRGSRRVSKPGIAVLAARTQTAIVPVAATATRAWRTRSWDRFWIPKP